MDKRSRYPIVAAILGLLVATPSAHATADGYFDPTWAGGGSIVFPGDYLNPTLISQVDQVSLEANGNLLLAGAAQASIGYWWLGELLPGGDFVPTFGKSNGYGRISECQLRTCASGDDSFLADVLQADGKILVLSQAANGELGGVTRTTTQAHQLDTSVTGGSGYVSATYPINSVQGSVLAIAHSIVVQPDGKVLAAGVGYYSQAVADSGYSAFGIFRLNPDLSLDTSFNAITDVNDVTFAGGAVIQVVPTDIDEVANTILLQPDGRIILVGIGTASATGSMLQLEAVRLAPDGSLDTTFGSNGAVALTWTGGAITYDGAFNAVLDRAGRILVPLVGVTSAGVSGMLIARLNPDGSPDTSFSVTGGFVFNEDAACDSTLASALALDSAGRIVVAGTCTISGAAKIVLERVRGDNSALDTSFGVGGYSAGDFVHGNMINAASAIVFDQSGRPVVAGYSAVNADAAPMAAVARLTYDLIFTNNFDPMPPGCLPPNCFKTK